MVELQREVLARARMLSERRKSAASHLTQMVEAELCVLDMVGCRFEVSIHHGLDEVGEPITDTAAASFEALGPDGVDTVEFMIAPNRGEVLRSMARIAALRPTRSPRQNASACGHWWYCEALPVPNDAARRVRARGHLHDAQPREARDRRRPRPDAATHSSLSFTTSTWSRSMWCSLAIWA